jgi:iron complex transport system substrate-binding protein
MQDVTQIELVILGKEKELTIVDDTGEAVTVKKPIESFVYHGHNSYVYETLRAIDAADGIIGISDRFVTPGKSRYSEAYYPELCGFTNVGILKTPDYEVVNTLRPDVVISDEERYYDRTKTPGIPVVAMDVRLANFREATMKFGYIFDRVEEAEEYINWYNDLEDEVNERIEGLTDDEKELVYIGYYNPGTTSYQVPARDNYRAEMVYRAGGDYIGDEIDGTGMIKVDAEWVITRNPDVIIFSGSNQYVGYDIEDTSEVIALIDDFTSRPDVAGINAVINNRVYVVSHAFILCGGASGLIGTTYYAKWMYPDLFADMDVTAMHQEFVTRFQRIDLDLEECYCVYPQPT